MANKKLKIAGRKKPAGDLPIRPGPIDPKTGKPAYYYEDWRGYKGPYAKKGKSKTKDKA